MLTTLAQPQRLFGPVLLKAEHQQPVSRKSLQLLHPDALSLLTCGRRLTWVLPVGGALPTVGSSAATWGEKVLSDKMGTAAPLSWSDARLSCVWDYIGQIRSGGRVGLINATCYHAIDHHQPRPPRLPWPDHIRIQVAGHLALTVRFLLEQVHVPGERRFLVGKEGIRLLLVDETGRALLVA